MAAECFAQGPPRPIQPSGANVLVLEVRLDSHLVSDGVTAYQAGPHILLPLGELARLLTLAIRADPEDGTARGFVLSEDRPFYLDARKLTVGRGDRVEPVDPALLAIHPDDIYVASTLLSRWLPIDFAVDFSSLILTVRAREALPLQRRLQRERDAAKARRASRDIDPGYPRHRTPYAMWDAPFIDATLAVEAARRNSKGGLTGRHSTFFTGDLLGFESSMFVSGTEKDPVDSFRATMGRTDPEARLLGPLRARAYAVGNVPVPSLNNVSRSSGTGNGLVVSNVPLTRPGGFLRRSFQGDLPPGWDAELYFNDALIRFQPSRPDGRYTFDDVQLIYGRNEFRIVFHGPQGQIRVERQSFLLQDTLTRPGEVQYHFAAHENDRDERRSLAQFDLGLHPNLSASGGVVTLPVAGEDRVYSHAGLRAQWAGFFVTTDVAVSDGGALVEAGALTQIGAVSVAFSHAMVRNFTSDFFMPGPDTVTSRDKFRADGGLGLIPGVPLSYAAEVALDQLESGKKIMDGTGRLSALYRGTSVTKAIHFRSGPDSASSSEGALNVSSRFGRLGLRGQVNYTLQPVRELSTIALAGTYPLSQGYVVSAGVQRGFSTEETRYNASLTKTLGAYGYGIAAAYSSKGEIVISAQMFIAFARDPRRAEWAFDALPMAETGAVSARVFVDKNSNGVMDDDEEALKGVAFTVNGGRHQQRTGEAGLAYLRRLPVKEPVDIAIDASTLEDPQWSPRPAGVRVVPRPGKVASLDFAVILTGEIDGTVYVRGASEKRELISVMLELLNDQGLVVGQTQSAGDGFYVLSNVPPGAYRVRLRVADMAQRGFVEPASRPVTIGPDGTFVNGIDFAIERIAKKMEPGPASAQSK